MELRSYIVIINMQLP